MVTLHARGRLGSLPSIARLGGKFGEGRAGAPGDQALLQMDGALLQSIAAGSVGIPPLKYNEFIKWIVFDFCEMLIISSLPWK